MEHPLCSSLCISHSLYISLLIYTIAQQCTWDCSHFKELKNQISELVSGLPKVRQLVSGRINVRIQPSLALPLGLPSLEWGPC